MSEIIPYIWLGIIVFAAVVEIHAFAFVTVWFILPALISFTLSLLDINVWIQVLVFFVISVLLLVLSRTILKKSIKYDPSGYDYNYNSYDYIIGRPAIVTEEINNYKSTGTIRINGLVFPAESDDDDIIYESGLVVTVARINANGAQAVCSR